MTAGTTHVAWGGRLASAFAADRTFWKIAAAVLGVFSVAKGLGRPSGWAATQALFNYDHGLLKRGLFGATLGKWLHLEHFVRFAVVSYGLLAVLMVLVVAFAVQSGALRRLGAGEPVAIFFGSFAVTYVTHLVGYLDISLAILAVGLLLVRDATLRLLLAVPVAVAGSLLHEMFLVVFLPTIAFSWTVDALQTTDVRRRRWIAGMAVGVCVVCAATTMVLALKQPRTQAMVDTLTAEMVGRADFHVRLDVPPVLTASAAEGVRRTMHAYRAFPEWFGFLADSVIAFLPAEMMLLVAIVAAARGAFTGQKRRTVLAAAGIAALSPLAMNLIGLDSARWQALICLDSFLVLLVLCRSLPETGVSLPRWYRNAAVLAIAIGMVTGETLMDDKMIHTFPFFGLFRRGMHGLG